MVLLVEVAGSFLWLSVELVTLGSRLDEALIPMVGTATSDFVNRVRRNPLVMEDKEVKRKFGRTLLRYGEHVDIALSWKGAV